MNHGLWDGYDTKNPVKSKISIERLAQEAHAASSIVVWKTTTANRWHNIYDSTEFVQDLVSRGFYIFDAYTITRDKQHEINSMWDNMHFQGYVYRELNIALLEHIKDWFAGGKTRLPPRQRDF